MASPNRQLDSVKSRAAATRSGGAPTPATAQTPLTNEYLSSAVISNSLSYFCAVAKRDESNLYLNILANNNFLMASSLLIVIFSCALGFRIALIAPENIIIYPCCVSLFVCVSRLSSTNSIGFSNENTCCINFWPSSSLSSLDFTFSLTALFSSLNALSNASAYWPAVIRGSATRNISG